VYFPEVLVSLLAAGDVRVVRVVVLWDSRTTINATLIVGHIHPTEEGVIALNGHRVGLEVGVLRVESPDELGYLVEEVLGEGVLRGWFAMIFSP
jgi:hypothetical protein